jgi:hypothetical protein
MREIRLSGSEGGEAETNRPSLPLSLALLATGLMGLLAYAWRKRK